MVQYTLAQSPDVILTVPGKDSSKAREKAMDQLIELMESGELPTDLSEGFGPHQFIEIKEIVVDNAEEDAIAQAVQILSNLAILKQRVQASQTEAMAIRLQMDPLLNDEWMTDEEFAQLREGFKALKAFAQLNIRYREMRLQAEQARLLLDQALRSPEKGPQE
jgi:hypothetical protein